MSYNAVMLRHLFAIALFLITSAGHADWAQIGSQWDKKEVTKEVFANLGPAAKKAAMALGHIRGGASAFYIGKHGGKHLGVTNHHVYPGGCRDEIIDFEFMGRSLTCTNLIGTWPTLDLTIFELRVPKIFEAEVLPNALKFAFKKDIYPGQKLVTVGYGHHHNPQARPMIDESEDCRVFSAKNEFVFKLDPDQHLYPNDPDFNVWSIANGCEASQGDSGSAILDRETGEVVAVLWAMTPNRPERMQDSKYLESLLTNPVKDDIWGQMNYASAVPKIYEMLNAEVNPEAVNSSSVLDSEQIETLRVLLSN